jgi:hypothetical protein
MTGQEKVAPLLLLINTRKQREKKGEQRKREIK